MTHKAEPNAKERHGLAALGDGHLGGPAADVDEQLLAEDAVSQERAFADEPCLFTPGDDVEEEPGLVVEALKYLLVVARLSQSARRHRAHLGVEAHADLRVAAKRGDEPVLSGGGDDPRAEDLGAWADGIALLVQGPERAVRSDPSDLQARCVGADIDGCEGRLRALQQVHWSSASILGAGSKPMPHDAATAGLSQDRHIDALTL